MSRQLEVLLNADPLALTPAVQCRNLSNLYPCLAMERSPTAVSPLPQSRCRSLGQLPRPAGMQTLLVQRLQAHLQRSDSYPAPSKQAVAAALDAGDVSAVSGVLVSAYCQGGGGAYPDQLSVVLVAAECRPVLRDAAPIGRHGGS